MLDKGFISSLSFGIRPKYEGSSLPTVITLGEWSDSYVSIDYKQIMPNSASGDVLWASELKNMSLNGLTFDSLFINKSIFVTFEPNQQYSYIYFKEQSDY